MTSPKAVDGGEAAVAAAAAETLKAKVVASESQALMAWPYLTFGTPSGVAERRDVADIDAVFLRFNNGVRLTVKPTKFKTDRILVRVNFGDGRLGLDPRRPNPEWASGSMIEGGLGKLSLTDLERTLSGRIFSASLGILEDTYVLSGGTRGEDLDLELQVLAAYLTDPGWRPEAFGRYSALSTTVHDQLASTSSGVLGRDLGALLRSGDRRWAFPAREELAATRLEDLKAALSPSMASGPIEVVIVGDITVEKAVDAVNRTFGALPARPGPVPPPADQVKVKLPQGGGPAVVRTHKGRADQAVLFTAWPTTDFLADPKGARANRLLAEILNLRLTDELREKQGATYSPSADSTQSWLMPDYGYISTVVEIPPDKIEAVTRDIQRIAADLTAKPPTADEMTRARKPILEGIQEARETNGYWLGTLSGMQADPRQLDAYRSSVPTLERLTPADIQVAARTWLRPDRIWRMEVRPETAAAAKAP
jgi:zinc protease